MPMSEKGILYLVATPIGNLGDMTFRAVKVLKEADIIAAEDTRQTQKLLNHFEILRPVTSYYQHNSAEKGDYLTKCLLKGKTVALVSDAGTPGISDPGEGLVRLAIDNGITVSIIPGAAAAIAGLVISGMPAGRFVFEGFLPVKNRIRKERLESLKTEDRTIIFYEAPHKLLNTLKDLVQYFGNRKISLAREITKIYEEVVRCTLIEAVEKYTLQPPRGEFVLVVEGADRNAVVAEEQKSWGRLSIKEHVELYMKDGMEKKEAMKKAADDRGSSKRDIYRQFIGV